LKGAWEGAPEPCKPNEHEIWLADIRHWRDERRIRVGYDGSRYDLPALKWTQSSFIQPQMMIEDRYFYDPVRRRYTVDRYLADLEKRYGGIDAVMIWQTYPNIGIDDKNQLDMTHAMPGGIDAVRQMVADFHRRGVRVLFMMMLDDNGTHDPGMPWQQAIAELMKEVGADGVNVDSNEGVPLAFTLVADQIGHPLAFEPELGPSDEQVQWDNLTWGYWDYAFFPTISRYKWLEPRHMVNVCDRFNRDKTDNLQYAFFNGVGWESWENVWGIWNGITPRDAEATRRVATMERTLAPFLVSKDWEPYSPMLRFGVYASRWPLGAQTVWTIVNRNEYVVSGLQMRLPAESGMRYFDLYHGTELTPRQSPDGTVFLSFDLEAHGYGAVLSSPTEPDASVQTLMSRMRELAAKPLTAYTHEWKVLPQQIAPIAPTKPPVTPAAGMIKIPEGDFRFQVQGLEIEGADDVGIDVQYPWEDTPRRYHDHLMHVKSFWIDKYPVTNAQFKAFLDATHYHPEDDFNFLHDWKDGTYAEGAENKPVTWVSLEDARVYARWAGKRLPHEWEWQYAAQGTDGRAYPWGETWKPEAVPTLDTRRSIREPDAVDAHPQGASPFGVMDLVGNVWQWTEEFVDEHTRAATLRGGSYYQPQSCIWYFPQAYRLSEHGKLLLMSAGRDRAKTLGFRCAQDGK
jgi:formylglycine-generating enzyme required for sulfatase activity